MYVGRVPNPYPSAPPPRHYTHYLGVPPYVAPIINRQRSPFFNTEVGRGNILRGVGAALST